MTLLEQRNQSKKRKPTFRQQDSHKKSSIVSAWRRPKGLHSKVRYGKHGYARAVSTGFGSPAEVRGLTRDGLRPVLVASVADLQKLVKGDGALIASGVGMKKRIDIVTKAKEAGIAIINVKDADAYLKGAAGKLSERAARKKSAPARREPKKDDAKPAPASTQSDAVTTSAAKENAQQKKTEKPEEKKDAAQSVDEQKKAEKAEKDKLITKRL